mmetsp:Transcript_20754/g.49052  ORF Transcript_20754/g.49052 Transcript_20754/m.49052 type:complete len:314 (-) Transcript_20754:1215-2156(-)
MLPKRTPRGKAKCRDGLRWIAVKSRNAGRVIAERVGERGCRVRVPPPPPPEAFSSPRGCDRRGISPRLACGCDGIEEPKIQSEITDARRSRSGRQADEKRLRASLGGSQRPVSLRPRFGFVAQVSSRRVLDRGGRGVATSDFSQALPRLVLAGVARRALPQAVLQGDGAAMVRQKPLGRPDHRQIDREVLPEDPPEDAFHPLGVLVLVVTGSVGVAVVRLCGVVGVLRYHRQGLLLRGFDLLDFAGAIGAPAVDVAHPVHPGGRERPRPEGVDGVGGRSVHRPHPAHPLQAGPLAGAPPIFLGMAELVLVVEG